MIDWNKPVRTKCGKPVRVLCTDRKWDTDAAGPIILLVDDGGKEWLRTVNRAGRHRYQYGQWFEFENVPEKCVAWVNVYRDRRRGRMYPSKEEADRKASKCRIACVRVEYEIPVVGLNDD